MQENIMNKIDAIEKQAEAIIDNAISKKASMGTNLNKELNDIDSKLGEATEQKIAEIKKNKDKILSEKVDYLKSSYQEKISFLDKDFQKNKSTYTNKIFKNIIED